MSISLDGANGITYPAGVNPQAAPSKVLQVVQASLPPTSVTTSSTSFVTSTLAASITPLFSTSKILVIVAGGGVYTGTNNQSAYLTIYRGSTNLGDANYGLGRIYAYASSVATQISMNWLDSPATTSSTTYTAYFRAGGSYTVDFSNSDRGTCTITLMEIAA